MDSSHRIRSLDAAALNYFQYQNEDSLNKVIDAATDLIHFYGNLYGKGCDKEDLFQTGILGLMKALKHYDSGRDASFVTYASHLIMGEIRHMVRKQIAYYRPGCIIELQSKVDHVVQDYVKLHGDIPSYAYIAQQLNVKVESVDEVMKAGLISFDEIDTAKIRSLAYESFRLPIEDKITLYQAIKKLTDLQQKIIEMLFFQDMSQQQVADKMGMTQKKVSRIKQSSLESLYETIQEELPPLMDHHGVKPIEEIKRFKIK
jgi:RNA polymerase sigma-B factor